VSYVDKNLIPGESVVYRGSLTGLPYAWLVLPVAGAIGTAIVQQWIPAAVCAGIAIVMWAWLRMRLRSAEFAVTNKRVMIKLGILHRRTTETLLSKIENISVDQGIWGRICNYGSITVTGTGGTREMFERIAAPLEFRRQVQAQLARLDDERRDPVRSGLVAPS
jgi:uncharacterized membrane protein YdbT with pleckstrin-like domain